MGASLVPDSALASCTDAFKRCGMLGSTRSERQIQYLDIGYRKRRKRISISLIDGVDQRTAIAPLRVILAALVDRIFYAAKRLADSRRWARCDGRPLSMRKKYGGTRR
jgi:hypothetical protein